MKIAIKGHASRGKEVIQILESLGGNNYNCLNANAPRLYYYNGNFNYIDYIHRELINRDTCKLYTLEEFEKEFPFKIGDKVIYSYTPNFVGTVVDIKFDDNIPYRVDIKGTIYTCWKTNLKPYKEMDKRNITLTLEKAKEWYNKGGELKEVALQAFTEKELNPLPRSWEEFCKRGNPIASWRYAIPTKYEALYKLEQLRNCWWNGWEPEWNASHKYAIKNSGDGLHIIVSSNISAFLVFPTKEMAEEFLECFRDLIEKAKDLI